MKKRTLLLGRGTIAVNCLEILNKKHELPAVVLCDTNDTGEDTWTRSLYKNALELGYIDGKTLFRERGVNKPYVLELLKKDGIFDIIFSIQPYAIFRKPFIDLAKEFVVNMHMAPLPKLRGVAPCSHAILDGLAEMGVTMHLIEDEGIDNGPIIFQKIFPINDDDTAWTLFNSCVAIGTELFANHIDEILNGEIAPIPQDGHLMTYHPMHEIDFSQCEVPSDGSADEAYRFIRSRIFPPFQLPYIIRNHKKIMIEQVSKHPCSDQKKHGDLLFYKDGCIAIDRSMEVNVV